MGAGQRILWSQVRIGVAVTLALAIGALAVFFIDETRDAIEARYTLYFHTFTTQTLRPRAPVWLAGQPVGHVTSLRFETPTRGRGELLHVELSISLAAQPFITEGAAAQVITSGLIGEAVVNILPARLPARPLAHRTDLPTVAEIEPMQIIERFEELYDSIPPVLDRWRAVLRRAHSGPGTLPRIVRGPGEILELLERFNELAATFDTVGVVAKGFSGVLADREVQAALGRIGSRLTELAERWEAGAGSAGAFARDTSLAASLDRITASMARISERLETGRGTLGRLMNDDALRTELRKTREMLGGLRADLRGTGAGRRALR